ncbi:transposase [Lactobacillus rhamnosus]|nr:hypothetical protein DU507_02385 [Lacticaseibacillus rhamnosus GG]KAA1039064.1 transposase [Lacticaseibacillus paracasei]MBB1166243.1 transposase [Lacticaseibacillus rhamnosus]PTV02131.1 hypothetical protein DB338_14925 [Lacticaseibacillus rhamnosus]QFG50333.1 transposase [Lacticaseibacillus rhamnosus]
MFDGLLEFRIDSKWYQLPHDIPKWQTVYTCFPV